MFTIGSLFSGIGGIDLAAQWAGFETAWFVEKEPYCQQVLARHWPSIPIYGDVFKCHNLPHVDVIAGGFPCQPFSVAGKRQGANDERYLLPEMLRIVSEVQPHVVLFENVPGFPSLNDGNEFKHLLRALAGMGFNAQWGHLRASDIGAPHRRERWFCVAYASSGNGNGRAKSINGRANGIEIHSDANMGNARLAGLGGCNGATQSRLGRNADGLPGGMDAHRWPARPGEAQHDFEPPRVTGEKGNRAARLKALGNAVVPQVVYPLFLSIHEWLNGG